MSAGDMMRAAVVLAIALLGASAARCAAPGPARAADRSRPPVADPSPGGFTIRRLDAPVVVDGRQWIAVSLMMGNSRISAPNQQFSVTLADPNEEGDIVRYRATFTAGD